MLISDIRLEVALKDFIFEIIKEMTYIVRLIKTLFLQRKHYTVIESQIFIF